MEIQLSPEIQQIIDDKIATGKYSNASEFIREAVLQTIEREQLKLSKLNEAISIGIEQAEKGKFSKRSVKNIINDKKSGK